jgi:hypothetical protein
LSLILKLTKKISFLRLDDMGKFNNKDDKEFWESINGCMTPEAQRRIKRKQKWEKKLESRGDKEDMYDNDWRERVESSG